ncbi:MAG TPA: M56 family metallopeptidase [Pyrinomonadaceae bacterium]
MFVTAVENFILFGTLLALGGTAFAWGARAAALRGWWGPHPLTLTRVYSLGLLLPPVAATWIVAAAFLPEWWLGEEAFGAAHPAPLHRLHLLSDLTAALEPRLAYATLAFAAAASAFAAWSSASGYARVGRVVRRLEMGAVPPRPEQVEVVRAAAGRHRMGVGLVMSDCPLSFVWGFRRSKLILSSGLLNALTPEQLRGVIEHEAAHHSRRDNAVKLILSVASYLSLAFPLSRLILRWRAEQVEMVCDEVAAARTAEPLEIADALVRVRRAGAWLSAGPLVAASGFMPDGVKGFERRVHRLVSLADSLPSPERSELLARPPRAGAAAFALLFTLTLLSVSVLAPLAVHRATESFIQLLS